MGNPFSCLCPKSTGKSRGAGGRGKRRQHREGESVAAASAAVDANTAASVNVDAVNVDAVNEEKVDVDTVNIDTTSIMRIDTIQDEAWELEDIENEENIEPPSTPRAIEPYTFPETSLCSRPGTTKKPMLSAESRRSVEHRDADRLGFTKRVGIGSIPVSLRQEHQSFCKRMTNQREMTRTLKKLHESSGPVHREALPATALVDTSAGMRQGDSGDGIQINKNGEVCEELNTKRCLKLESVTIFSDIGESDKLELDKNTCLPNKDRSIMQSVSKQGMLSQGVPLNSKTHTLTTSKGLGRRNEIQWQHMDKSPCRIKSALLKKCSVDESIHSLANNSKTEGKYIAMNNVARGKISNRKDESSVRAITKWRPKQAKLVLQALTEDTVEEEKTEIEEFCLDIILKECLTKIKFGYGSVERKSRSAKKGHARICKLDVIAEDEAGEENAELEDYCACIIYQRVDLMGLGLGSGELNTNNNAGNSGIMNVSKKSRIFSSSLPTLWSTDRCAKNGQRWFVVLDTRPILSWKLHVESASKYCEVEKNTCHAVNVDQLAKNAYLKGCRSNIQPPVRQNMIDISCKSTCLDLKEVKSRKILSNKLNVRTFEERLINYKNDYIARTWDRDVGERITKCLSDSKRRVNIKSNGKYTCMLKKPETFEKSNNNAESAPGHRDRRPEMFSGIRKGIYRTCIPSKNENGITNRQLFTKLKTNHGMCICKEINKATHATNKSTHKEDNRCVRTDGGKLAKSTIRRQSQAEYKTFPATDAASCRQNETVRGPDRGIVWPRRMEDLFSAKDRAYYVEQFQRTEMFRQRLKRKQLGRQTWCRGLSQFQTWVVENFGTNDMETILHPKI